MKARRQMRTVHTLSMLKDGKLLFDNGWISARFHLSNRTGHLVELCVIDELYEEYVWHLAELEVSRVTFYIWYE